MHGKDVNTETTKKQRAVDPASEFIDSYDIFSMAQLSVRQGDARSYASMRAAQLSSLLFLTYGGGGEFFHDCSQETKDNVLWLAAGLSQEMEHLIPIACAEAVEAAAIRGGK
jgi:hypothetical protein